jgi:hypothetical protein
MANGNLERIMKIMTKKTIKYTKDNWNKSKLWIYEDLKELLIRTREHNTYFTTEEIRELLEEVYKEDFKNIIK